MNVNRKYIYIYLLLSLSHHLIDGATPKLSCHCKAISISLFLKVISHSDKLEFINL